MPTRRMVVVVSGLLILVSGVLVYYARHQPDETGPSLPGDSTIISIQTRAATTTVGSAGERFQPPLPTAHAQATPIGSSSTPVTRHTYTAPPIFVPADYRQTFTHYATVDRADGDGAVRVLYITSAAIPAFQKTGVFPDGTMVIMEIYQPQTAPDGSMQHDPSGHFVPGQLHSVLVKLKVRPDATPVSTAAAATVTQRGWVYAAFDATTGNVDGFNQPLCQSCHLRAQAWDDLFTRPELLAFAQTAEPQYLLCQFTGKQPCQTPER